MNYLSLKVTKNGGSNRLLLFVCILVTNSSVFAQTEKNLVDVNTVAVATTKKQENVSTVSASNSKSMHFILWFMGSKQDLNSTLSAEGNNTKKQIITSGVAPNRVLIKTFLKKAVNLENMMS